MPDADRPLTLIHRASGDAARTQRLGPYHIEALIERQEEGAGTAYRVHIEPERRTAVSYHRVAEEFYYVLSGGGRAFFDGKEYALRPGDFVRLPPGTTHGFEAGPAGLDMLDLHLPGCWPDHDTYFVDQAPEGFAASGRCEPAG